ncbi:hypothetical protein NQ314_019261 [Rhamnusium bicolor]|uniref:GH18 domain-containing protein n=1 Tax=Rhamnusium bicolor TaxID=1586634 RepID=A0AAV8WP30_9CUCU|nr:hypothetical protein NQ314_019261 [Rhamnusium bicolor]
MQCASDKVVCYFRNSDGSSLARPENLDANLCTHINYAFIIIDESGNLTVQSPTVDITSGNFLKWLQNKNIYTGRFQISLINLK